MSTHEGNGNGATHVPRHDPRTADLGDPETLRDILVETHDYVRELLGVPATLKRIEEHLVAQGVTLERAATAADAAITDVRGARLDVAKLTKLVAEQHVAMGAAVYIADLESQERTRLVEAKSAERSRLAGEDIKKLHDAQEAMRENVNKLSSDRPDVDDLEAVSAVHDIDALVERRFEQRAMESMRAKLATLHEGERKWADKKWEVAKIVLGALVVILMAYGATRLGLK